MKAIKPVVISQSNYLPDQSLINSKLNDDCLLQIFSYLDQADKTSCFNACRRWYFAIVKSEKQQASFPLRRIVETIDLLMEQLTDRKYMVQKDKLLSIRKVVQSNLEEQTPWHKVKNAVYQSKEELLNMTKLLDNAELNELEKKLSTIKITAPLVPFDWIPDPVGMRYTNPNNIVKLSRIYQKLEEVKAMLDNKQKDYQLNLIVNDLIDNGQSRKALRVSDLSTNKDIKNIGKALFAIATCQLEKALESAKDISRNIQKNELLTITAYKAIRKKQFNIAIDAALNMSDKVPSHAYGKKGAFIDIDGALEKAIAQGLKLDQAIIDKFKEAKRALNQ